MTIDTQNIDGYDWTERFDEKLAKKMNINWEVVQQIGKQFLGYHSNEMKQCPNVIVANKIVTLQKGIAPIKRTAHDKWLSNEKVFQNFSNRN